MWRAANITAIVWSLLTVNHAFAQEMFKREVLELPSEHREVFENLLPVKEIPVFVPVKGGKRVLMENGYAEHRFQNIDWPPQGEHVRPLSINIIFTKYPKDNAFWLTDYHWLLARRLEALFELDTALNSNEVKFNIILQTDCDNEFEAMQLFHGIEIIYETMDSTAESSDDDMDAVAGHTRSPGTTKLKRLMSKEGHNMDSTIYNSLADNPQWKDATLVIDWTGSMYGYGAEALLWHVENQEESGIEQVVVFNDGDKKPTRKKKIGSTGGIYASPSRPASKALKLITKVKHKGTGGDSPENDIEALIYAMEHSQPGTPLILVADNQSCIRDFLLLSCLNRPVHIILCGTSMGINHQYLNLALHTGGSVHGDGFSVSILDELASRGEFSIAGQSFTMSSGGWIVPTDRRAGSFGNCSRYYKSQKILNKQRKRRKEPKCYFTD